MDFPDGELSILLVDDQQIETLNKKYLNRKGPTNVIAFPMHEGQYNDITPNLLGDVAISVETAKNEANAANLSMQYRFNQLLIHGILHLVGYDHEAAPREAQRMEKKSNEILKLINDFLVPDFNIDKKELKIAFSGHRGYHLKIENEKIRNLSSAERREMTDYLTGENLSFDILGISDLNSNLQLLRRIMKL